VTSSVLDAGVGIVVITYCLCDFVDDGQLMNKRRSILLYVKLTMSRLARLEYYKHDLVI
jgi:hypothetical protein